MIFSVFANLEKSESLGIAKEMVSVLSGENCRLCFHEKYKRALDGADCMFVPADEMYKVCDIAVAVGGDGTTMKVAKNAAVNGKPALGVNGGRLGFLSAVERNEISLLEAVLKGDYIVDERIMLRADVIKNGTVISHNHCLNDAVLSRGDFARLIDINIKSDETDMLSVRADGVIISTPTGSTAYSLAAGGPVLSPDLNCFVITSICPHSLMDRSLVVNSKYTLNISVRSDVSNNAIFTCDGETPVEIDGDCVASISLSNYKAKLIKIKPDNFYQIVKKKIIERGA
ncbi:MAG TPA: NAD(+)/NADH kinase [Candidatus Eubacterium faecavium]|nr:NAD(+)/NADH kinase [Candidatus Eubacterium faecavium]